MRAVLLLLLLLLLMPGLAGRAATPERESDAWFTQPLFQEASGAPVSLASVLAGANRPELALVRLQAEWCGPCQIHASESEILLTGVGDRLRIVDVLVADRDNGAVSADAVSRWQARAGDAVTTLRGESTHAFDVIFRSPSPLPRLLLVDARTGHTLRTLSGASSAEVFQAVAETLNPGSRTEVEETLVDGRFAADQWQLIEGMRLPARPPPDPSNRVADDAAAAAFGRTLFSDTTLSPAGRACSSCHEATLLFTNGKDVASEGAGAGSRNVPTILLASHARSLLWDGRADSGWHQAVLPFEDPTEMGSTRLFVAHAVARRHRDDYEAVFGALPPLADAVRFPASGAPGSDTWEGMQTVDRYAISAVLANVGKALSAFERSLRVQPNALDRYASGEHSALTDDQKDGLHAFMTAGCAQCHNGPRLTDDAFHNLRFPTGRSDRQADRGRADGVPLLLASEFRRSGSFSDAPAVAPLAAQGEHAAGAFRTPSLRGVPFTMPYGHGGGFGGLTSVIEAHRTGGLPVSSRYAVGAAEAWAQGFDPALTPKIVAFLQVLRADLVVQPGHSTMSLRAEIEALNAAMVAAFNANPATVASFYTDDARITGGGQSYQGRDEIDRYWAGMTTFASWRLEIVEVGGHRDSPWQYSRSVLTSKGGRTFETMFVGVLQRASDGALKFRVDMFTQPPKTGSKRGDVGGPSL